MNNESLCCQAPINEQFHTCTDCGEHAEPVKDPGPACSTYEPDTDPVNSLLGTDERSDEPYCQRGGRVTAGEAAIFLFAVMVVLAALGGSQ